MKTLKFFTNLAIIALVFSFFLYLGCKKDKDVTPTGNNIGNMLIDPGQVITGQYTDMAIEFTLNPDVTLPTNTTELTVIQIDPTGARTELTKLYDNGNLSNHDEIKGDHTYSNKISFYSLKTGEFKLIISTPIVTGGNTKTVESNEFKFTVYADLKAGTLSGILNTQENAGLEFKKNVANNINNVQSSIDKTIAYLKGQANVQDAVKASTGIAITYKSGIKAALIISVEDKNGNFTQGGLGKDTFPPRHKYRLPLALQTRGNIKKAIQTRGEDIDANLIGNRKVLIYEPFQSIWQQQQGPSKTEIIKIFNEDKCAKYDIKNVINTDANIDVVSTFAQYGFILLETHGSAGESFSTGEYVDSSAANFANKYKALLQAQKLSVWRNIKVAQNGAVDILKDVYAINYSYINDLAGKFPNSLIINMSCESTKSAFLSNAFIVKGAGAYVGFSEVVYTNFSAATWLDAIKTVVKDGKTIGEMAKKGEVSTQGYGNPAVYARVDILGLESLKLPKDLLNGSFEAGLKGWTASGDGRYISNLGFISPIDKDFMGIISTGLGFTTATGSIYQSFTVPNDAKTLSFNWNLLSEEFLEYIGSQYQDQFSVVIIDESGNENVLYSRTIDGIAADYGATKEKTGNLIGVSPDISFDQGDVYMTGFETASYDISAYKGKCITLEFRCTDVGDSAYDTAILIDNVQIEK